MKTPLILNIAAICCIVVFFLQALLAVPRLSATVDEPLHLAAGYSYWQTRDFRMNPEHPPLAKLVAALPLLALRPSFDTSDPSWKQRIESTFAFRFLYHNDADRLLFWSRAAMISIAALGCAITFLWARDLFGAMAGVFAAALYAFCPNLLAHGMLVTTDAPLAAFTVLTLYLFWKRGEHPSWRSDFATGLALGAAMASKFSGGVLPIVLIGFCLARKQVKSLFIMAAGALLIIETAYLFSATPLIYFFNLRFVNANRPKDYPFYLLGQLKLSGWWYYFLAAFVVKATLPTLVLLVFAAVRAIRGFVDRWGELLLITTIVAYLVVISAAAEQVGVRYILPIFPLVFIWISRIVPDFVRARWRAVVLLALIAWHVWSGISAFPNYIPYFNELAGGARNGTAFLDDSNVDWGQGLKQAAEYARKRHLENLNVFCFDPFSSPASQYYGLPKNLAFPEVEAKLLSNKPDPGTYIISSHYVIRMKDVNPAWKAYQPIDRIGDSLWVYVF